MVSRKRVSGSPRGMGTLGCKWRNKHTPKPKNRSQNPRGMMRHCPSINTLPSVFVLHSHTHTHTNTRGQLETTVAEEKQFNPRLTKDLDTFVDIMAHLNLAPPKFIGKLSSGRTTEHGFPCVPFAYFSCTHSWHSWRGGGRTSDGDDGDDDGFTSAGVPLFVAFSIKLGTQRSIRATERKRVIFHFVKSLINIKSLSCLLCEGGEV